MLQKTPKSAVVQSREELESHVQRIGQRLADASQIEADIADLIEKISKAPLKRKRRIEREVLRLFSDVAAYARRNRRELTSGGRTKKVQLDAGALEWYIRRAPASLLVPHDEVLKRIRDAGREKEFIVTTETFSKEMMHKHPLLAKRFGVDVSRTEFFAAKPAGSTKRVVRNPRTRRNEIVTPKKRTS